MHNSNSTHTYMYNSFGPPGRCRYKCVIIICVIKEQPKR